MADTSHNTVTGELSAARQIRVFLSSTFRDFMEERDLLVKQLFPELRRKARERGVEVEAPLLSNKARAALFLENQEE